MNTCVFKCEGGVVDGRSLLGEYWWPKAMLVTGGVLTCVPPRDGVLFAEFEVDGEAVGAFTVPGSEFGEVTVEQALGFVVPAGGHLACRAWLNSSGSAPSRVSVTVSYRSAEVSLMRVVWRDGGERLPLYAYDAGSRRFVEVSPGLAASRAVIE